MNRIMQGASKKKQFLGKMNKENSVKGCKITHTKGNMSGNSSFIFENLSSV